MDLTQVEAVLTHHPWVLAAAARTWELPAQRGQPFFPPQVFSASTAEPSALHRQRQKVDVIGNYVMCPVQPAV